MFHITLFSSFFYYLIKCQSINVITYVIYNWVIKGIQCLVNSSSLFSIYVNGFLLMQTNFLICCK